MQSIEKASLGVVAAITTAIASVATGAVSAATSLFAVSTPMPFIPLSQLKPLQMVGGNGQPLQLVGAHFEANEPVQVFVLPAPEVPRTQYQPWLQVQTDGAGQFTRDLEGSLPPGAPPIFYISARGKRGYVAPIGPLRLPAVAPTRTPSAPTNALANAPAQPTLVPTSITAAQVAPPQPPAAPTPVNTDPVGAYYVSYYNNRDLADTAVITRNEAVVGSNWGWGGPLGLKADNFSVSYSGKFNFPDTENYEFVIVADDGVRLWVGNNLVVNEWRIGPRRVIRVDVPLPRGEHVVRLEYFDSAGGAQVSLTWGVDYSRWEARYYNSTDWTGPVVLKRDDGDDDGRLRMDWADRNPGPGVSADNFSASWERRVFFEVGGDYKFNLELDDGAKIYIDGVQVWGNLNGVGNHEFTRRLARGNHTLQVMYVEYGGGAKMKLDWTLIPPTPAPVP
jgi:hypothetical protein